MATASGASGAAATRRIVNVDGNGCCATSIGSEVSDVTVPSTIAVPSKCSDALLRKNERATAAAFVPPLTGLKTAPKRPAASVSTSSLPILQRRNESENGDASLRKRGSSVGGGAGFIAPSISVNSNLNFGVSDARLMNSSTTRVQVPGVTNTARAAPTPVAPANSVAVAPKNQVPTEDPLCVACNFPGADVRVRCPGGCAYHARCMDLAAICKNVNDAPGPIKTKAGAASSSNHKAEREVRVRTCPHCARPSTGMEILPLSFEEMDRVQRTARAAFLNSGLGLGMVASIGAGAKRSHDDLMGGMGLPTILPSHSGTQPRRTVQCYDPSQPRTGRWTDEEILFRDTLISHFLSGSLPLSNGLKLNDFLPTMLKSKQSRLAKKMKHAKLSTKYFYPKTGCVAPASAMASRAPAARELSRLEREFVASIPDPVERSEVRFHMSSQWRDHFAHRCHSLGIAFDGRAWLGSVEDMERRLTFEKERHRLHKRRFMMGKAMEKDCDPATGRALERGVFVSHEREARNGEFELVVEKSVSNSAGSFRRSVVGGNPIGRSSPSMGPIVNMGGNKEKEASPSVWSSNEPNFKHAAPFLAGIASYVERNAVPFEHVDVWVPSYVEDSVATEGSGSSSPKKRATDSPNGAPEKKASPNNGNFRLCFGGSVTMGVQLVDESSANGTSGSASSGASSPGASNLRRLPVSPETKASLSLFGQYSEKFSFSSGCGLPGRIFQSGIPTWEQYVSEAPASQFERRGGAIQFGVKTAVGLPIDSPNVGRVVMVLYSKYDRPKDERLVGRMMTDLKLMCPCPRWKLVVDVDSPLDGSTGGVGSPSSSLNAPPAVPPPAINTASAQGGMPPSSAPTGTISRSVSTGSGPTNLNAPSNAQSNVKESPANGNNATMSHKEKQIKSLLLLLASNIPSDMNSQLGQQLNGIMSLRLILLRGSPRTQEEEALVDTVLVLYESYLQAGRSQKDIAVMVARDFTFHLGHLGGLAAQFGGKTNSSNPTMMANNANNRVPPPTMYATAQPMRALVPPPPGPPMNPPMMGGYKHQAGPTPALAMGSNALMGPMTGFGAQRQPQQSQPLALRTPPMMAANSPMNPPMAYNHPRTQSMPFLPRQNSIASIHGSPRSSASR